MVFPELLGGVLAGDALEDLGSAWVLVGKVYRICQSSSWVMAVYVGAQELRFWGTPRLVVVGACGGRLTSDVVDVGVYDDVEAFLGVVVLGNFCGGELLRHVELCIVYIRREFKRCGREGEDPTLLNSPHLTFSPESRI